jgi:hypothetical protein
MTALNLLVVAINGVEDFENAACATEPWITFSVKPPAQTSLILKTHTIVLSSTSTTLISPSAGFGAAAHPLARSSIAMTRASSVLVTRSGVGAWYERNPIVQVMGVGVFALVVEVLTSLAVHSYRCVQGGCVLLDCTCVWPHLSEDLETGYTTKTQRDHARAPAIIPEGWQNCLIHRHLLGGWAQAEPGSCSRGYTVSIVYGPEAVIAAKLVIIKSFGKIFQGSSIDDTFNFAIWMQPKYVSRFDLRTNAIRTTFVITSRFHPVSGKCDSLSDIMTKLTIVFGILWAVRPALRPWSALQICSMGRAIMKVADHAQSTWLHRVGRILLEALKKLPKAWSCESDMPDAEFGHVEEYLTR